MLTVHLQLTSPSTAVTARLFAYIAIESNCKGKRILCPCPLGRRRVSSTLQVRERPALEGINIAVAVSRAPGKRQIKPTAALFEGDVLIEDDEEDEDFNGA